MPAIMMHCSRCGAIFSSGIALSGNASVHLEGNLSQCPSCGSMQAVPDGTFRNTVEGIVKVLASSPKPVEEARKILDELERAKQANSVSILESSTLLNRYKKWLPDSPEKIAAYIAIFYTIYLLLMENPSTSVEYNQTFIDKYQITIQQTPSNQKHENQSGKVEKKAKIGRNQSCPCGSGKKYKKCCLNKSI